MGGKKQTAKAAPAGKGGKDDKGGAKGGKGAKGKTQADGDDGKASKAKGGQWIVARHILCEKKSKFDEAKKKIDDEIKKGDKKPKAIYMDVAREFSEDKARQGGLLNKQTKGSLMAQFEEVAYGLQISSDKEIFMGEAKTSEGYHLIIVDDRG